MDYLNNVKREAQYSNAFLPGPHDVPHRHYDHVQDGRQQSNGAQDQIERVLRESERIDGQLYQAKEAMEDERDYLLGDKEYFDQIRDSQQKRREKRHKKKAAKPLQNKDYLEDGQYFNDS